MNNVIKLKVTRSDGVVIEAEGTAEELNKLTCIPSVWIFSTIANNSPYIMTTHPETLKF